MQQGSSASQSSAPSLHGGGPSAPGSQTRPPSLGPPGLSSLQQQHQQTVAATAAALPLHILRLQQNALAAKQQSNVSPPQGGGGGAGAGVLSGTSSPTPPQGVAHRHQQQALAVLQQQQRHVQLQNLAAAGAQQHGPGGTLGAPEKVHWVQCDRCDKWRVAPFEINATTWVCSQNTWDPRFASCSAPEEIDPSTGVPPSNASASSSSLPPHGNSCTNSATPSPQQQLVQQRLQKQAAALAAAQAAAVQQQQAAGGGGKNASARPKARAAAAKRSQASKTQAENSPSLISGGGGGGAASKKRSGGAMSADGKSLFGAAGGVGGATASLAASASSQGNANTNPASALMAAGLPFSALQHHAQLLQHTHHLQQQQHPHLLARNAGGTGSGLTVFQQEQLLQHQLLQQQQQRLLQHLQGGSHASVTQPQLVLEHWVQCDACNKWRRAPTQITSDKWFCRMNTWAPQFASCDVPEEPDPAAEGALEILGPGAAGNGGGGGGAVVEPQPQTGAGGTKRHRSAGGGRGGGSRGRAKAAKAAGNTANLSGGTGGGLKEELRDTEGGGGSLEDDTGGGGSTSSGGGAEGNFQSAKNSPVNMFSVVQQLASRVGGAARALQASPQSAGQTGIKQLPGRSASIGGGSGMSSHSATAQFAAALALEQQRLIQEGAREGLSALRLLEGGENAVGGGAAGLEGKTRDNSPPPAPTPSLRPGGGGGGGYAGIRNGKTLKWECCTSCSKWRRVPEEAVFKGDRFCCYMNVWNPSQASCNAPQEPWQAQRIGDVTGGERTPGGEERRGRDKSTGGGDDGEGPEVGGRLLTGAPASSGGASPLQPQQQRLQLLLQLQQSRGLSPPTSEQVARPTSQEPAVAAPRTVEENGAGERNVAGGGLQDGKENKDEEESSDNESEADDDGVSSGPNSEDEEEGGAGGGAAGGGMGGGGGGEGGRKEGGGNSAEHPPRDDGGGGGVEENETSGGGGSDAVGDSKASEGSAEEKGGVDAEELKAASLEAPFFEEETEAEGSFEKQLCVLGSSHQERMQVITLLPPSAEGITCLRLLSPPASTNALTVFAPSTRTFSFCGRFPLSVTSLSTVPRAWEHRFPSKLPSAPATSVSLPDSQRSLRRMRRRVTRVDSMKFGERGGSSRGDASASEYAMKRRVRDAREPSVCIPSAFEEVFLLCLEDRIVASLVCPENTCKFVRNPREFVHCSPVTAELCYYQAFLVPTVCVFFHFFRQHVLLSLSVFFFFALPFYTVYSEEIFSRLSQKHRAVSGQTENFSLFFNSEEDNKTRLAL